MPIKIVTYKDKQLKNYYLPTLNKTIDATDCRIEKVPYTYIGKGRNF